MLDPRRSIVASLLVAMGLAMPAPAQQAPPPVAQPIPPTVARPTTPATVAQPAPPAPVQLAPTPPAQDPSLEPPALVAQITEKSAAAKQYVLNGNLNISRKSGEGPMNSLAKAKIKLAVMPGDKYVLRVENADKTGYMEGSDGKTNWAYVPALKKYSMQEGVAVRPRYDSRETLEDPQSWAPAVIINKFARRVMPILAGLGDTPLNVFKNGGGRVRYEGQEYAWPVFTVLSKQGDQISQKLLYMTMDPASLKIGKMIWTAPVTSTGEKVLVRMDLELESLHMGELTADSEFAFNPPADAKRVDFLPTLGQTAAALVNKPAPDFELKSLDDRSVHLHDLKGHPVLLYFWTSWCGPCKPQFTDLAKFSEEYKDKGLEVLGIAEEGKETAAGYAKEANFKFNSLDDSAAKVRRMYRVQSLPTVVLINRKGSVVRYFSGVRDERTLRAALKSAGL